MSVKKTPKSGWMYDVRNPQGKRLRRKNFPTKSDADNAVTVLKMRWMSVKHGIPLHIEDKFQLGAAEQIRTQADRVFALAVDYSTKINRFRSQKLKEFADALPQKLPLTKLTEQHINQLRDNEAKRGITEEVVNIYLRYLKKALHDIQRHNEDMLSNWEIPKVNYLVVPKKYRTKLIKSDELNKLLAVLDNPPHEANLLYNGILLWRDASDFMRLAMLTGARKSEILSLTWRDVHFDWNVIKMTTLKRKGLAALKIRDIPITDEIKEILNRRFEQWREERCDYIFPKWKTDKGSQWIYRVLKKACEFAEVPYGRGLADGLLPHAARHTVASKMLLNGVDLNTAAEILGHTPETLLRRYAHATFDSKKLALKGLSLKTENLVSTRE